MFRISATDAIISDSRAKEIVKLSLCERQKEVPTTKEAAMHPYHSYLIKSGIRKEATSAHPLDVASELGGLGVLAVPSIYKLFHKSSPDDERSKLHRFMIGKGADALEVGGLATLTIPTIRALLSKSGHTG